MVTGIPNPSKEVEYRLAPLFEVRKAVLPLSLRIKASLKDRRLMSEVIDLYCDGGVIGKNPSGRGGTWAWVTVGKMGRVRHQSGVVQPDDVGLPSITNNLTELLAALEGMESLPDRWNGTIYTDSRVTQCRIRRTKKQAKLNGIPEPIRIRVAAAKARLGNYCVSLVGGHPSKNDLAYGHKRDGTPCSIHNVFCDNLCKAASRQTLAKV